MHSEFSRDGVRGVHVKITDAPHDQRMTAAFVLFPCTADGMLLVKTTDAR